MALVPLPISEENRFGRRLEGIEVEIVERDTVTPVSLFLDAEGTIPAAGPHITNIEGRLPGLWVQPGSYDRLVSAAIDTVDNRVPFEAASGSDSAAAIAAIEDFNENLANIPTKDGSNVFTGASNDFSGSDVTLPDGSVTYEQTDGHAARKASAETITGDWTLSDSVAEIRGNAFDDASIGAWFRATRLRVGSNLTNEGDGTAGSAGEDVMAIQAYTDQMPAGVATGDFEKSALLVRHLSNDDITGGNLPRDVVAIDCRGEIEDTNASGRVWGLYAEGQVRAGGDGRALAAEISIHNLGTDQGTINTPTSKVALALTAQDNGATAAIWIKTATAATFHHGIIVQQDDLDDGVEDTFINVHGATQTDAIFNVLRNGAIGIHRRPAANVGLDMVDFQGRAERAGGLDAAWSSRITGDTGNRWFVAANGQHTWSDGDGGGTVFLVRRAAGVLGTNGALQLDEKTAPASAADAVRLFAEDNGSGKTRLMAQFPTGSAIELAIEV